MGTHLKNQNVPNYGIPVKMVHLGKNKKNRRNFMRTRKLKRKEIIKEKKVIQILP